MFMSFLKNKFTLLQQNSVTDWCSSRSAPVWRLHSLGKTFLRISRIRNIPLIGILARLFVYVPPFISQILDFIYWTVLIFILIYFEWRDTENQQLHSPLLVLISKLAHLQNPYNFFILIQKEENSSIKNVQSNTVNLAATFAYGLGPYARITFRDKKYNNRPRRVLLLVLLLI